MIKIQLFGSFADSPQNASHQNSHREDNESRSTGSSVSNSPTSLSGIVLKRTPKYTLLNSNNIIRKKNNQNDISSSSFKKEESKNYMREIANYHENEHILIPHPPRNKAGSVLPLKRKFTNLHSCDNSPTKRGLLPSRRSASRNKMGNNINIFNSKEQINYGILKIEQHNHQDLCFTNYAKNTHEGFFAGKPSSPKTFDGMGSTKNEKRISDPKFYGKNDNKHKRFYSNDFCLPAMYFLRVLK